MAPASRRKTRPPLWRASASLAFSLPSLLFLFRLWDVSNGTCITKKDTPTSVKGVCFSYCGRNIAYTTDAMMKKESEINVMDTREDSDGSEFNFLLNIESMHNKYTTHLTHKNSNYRVWCICIVYMYDEEGERY